MWHDHATILKMGVIMVTVHDPVVFYTEEEYEELNPGADVNIQTEVGSSRVEDQAALIGDRISCLLELNGTDTLRFFTGDKNVTPGSGHSLQTHVAVPIAR